MPWFHRTFRKQFLSELDLTQIHGLGDINARLWSWIERVYHIRPHGGLQENKSPIEHWRDELHHVRPLLPHVVNLIDDLFYHREERLARKNGTISWQGNFYEVHHHLVGETVTLVFNPHTEQAIRIETAFGDNLGAAVLLDPQANLHRKRQRPHAAAPCSRKQENYAIESLYHDTVKHCQLPVGLTKGEE